MHDPVALFAVNASALNLVDPFKPVLFLIPLLVYMRLISTTIEKDLRFFNHNVAMWNGIFLASACGAMAAAIFIPIFFAGLPVMMLVLAAPLLAYWKYRNDRVDDEEQKFQLGAATVGDRMAARKRNAVQRNASAVLLDAKLAERPVPEEEDPLRPVHLAMEDVLLPAITARSTRLEVAVSAKGGSVAQMVDGVRYKREPLTKEVAASIVDYLKQAAGLKVDERRKKQRGRCGLKLREEDRRVLLDVTTSGSSQGIRLRVDIDRDAQLAREFEELGLEPEQLKVLEATSDGGERHGVILVATGPGQGLTTTLTTILKRHDAYTCNIKTLERDVQRMVEGVDHVEWDPNDADLDFPTQLRSIIRRGPDIVMISDLQDPATGPQAAMVGLDGPLVYLGVQTKDGVAGAITEWFRSVGDLKTAAKPLTTVMTSRTMRRLCPECRAPFTPSAEQAKKLGIKDPSSVQLFRQSGRVQVKNKIEECPTCRGTGFFGTVGVFEVMPIDRDARKLLAGGDLKAAYTHSRRSLGMMVMQEAALRKVSRGETSLEEVARVLSPEKTSRPTAGAGKSG
ncbi:MAG: Flp pilus assembly complex ATPase component [Phycisphaera sp.]|nr:Flp pilus assembly complex ATPase component [Phycisphaera sp.]